MAAPAGLQITSVHENCCVQFRSCLTIACDICRICGRRIWKTLGVLERSVTQQEIGLMPGCKSWPRVPLRGRKGRSKAICCCTPVVEWLALKFKTWIIIFHLPSLHNLVKHATVVLQPGQL